MSDRVARDTGHRPARWMVGYWPNADQIPDHMRLRGISRDDVIASMVAEQPAKRFVDTAEVAALITFLASDGGSAINGACIRVDTGTLAS